MNRYLSVIAAGTALLAASHAAHAVPVYQAQNYGPGTTVFISPALTFNGFDTTLGTLNSVEVNINNEQSTYSGSVTNTGQQPVTDTLTIATRITLVSSANTPAALTGLSLLTPVETFTFAGLASGATQYYGPVVETTSNNTFYIPTASLAQFENGSFSLLANGASPYSFRTGGSENSSNLVTAFGVISLEYDYTPAAAPADPVPEPASMALLGVGLVGAGLVRRRK